MPVHNVVRLLSFWELEQQEGRKYGLKGGTLDGKAESCPVPQKIRFSSPVVLFELLPGFFPCPSPGKTEKQHPGRCKKMTRQSLTRFRVQTQRVDNDDSEQPFFNPMVDIHVSGIDVVRPDNTLSESRRDTVFRYPGRKR